MRSFILMHIRYAAGVKRSATPDTNRSFAVKYSKAEGMAIKKKKDVGQQKVTTKPNDMHFTTNEENEKKKRKKETPTLL